MAARIKENIKYTSKIDQQCIFFKSLWVLDICNTDWELDLSPEIIEQVAANIREVHIKKGRFWHMNFSWGQLQNLHKLRVIDSTCSWEMGGKDEFSVSPTFLTSNCLKTLILDGCLALEHVEGLPLSLESFSLDAGPVKDDYRQGAKIRRICIARCARLSDFKLRGALPDLRELDLSGTKVKTLELRTHVVQLSTLQQVMLLGCEELRAVLWPKSGVPRLCLVCIDTRGEEIETIAPDLHNLERGHGRAYFAMGDMKFIQLLIQTSDTMFWNTNSRFSLNLCISSSVLWCNKEKIGSGSSGKICGPPSLIPKNSSSTYISVAINDLATDHDRNKSELQIQPLGYHVEIGEGISNTSMESIQGIKAVIFVMEKAKSLHVHDNSSITTVIPENMIMIDGKEHTWQHLKHCLVVRCPVMQTVFTTNYNSYCFQVIETLWAADLLMVHCIWSKGRTVDVIDMASFANLRSIYLYSCLRLKFVLPLSWNVPHSYFPNLEILHIVSCDDLKDVFPIEPRFLTAIVTDNRKGILDFPKLRHIYLNELYKLQHICEAKMFAPNLETVRLRGCWRLKRLPSVGQENQRCPIVECEKDLCEQLERDGLEASYHPSPFEWFVGQDNQRRPVVDCEKDWWEQLEWDGLEAGHHPSLFEPRHSSYYKKPLPRVSVLR